MSWSFNTVDRYHTQDTSYFCGAACAMMILNEIGVDYAHLDQNDLYTSNNSHNIQPGWATDPYGLCYTLNDRRPAAFLPNYFVVYKRLTEAAGTRDVVFTLYHYKVSPAILVYNCAHWNVVCGVQTDVDPASGPYVVDGFWLNNPVWDSSLSTHDGSDTCGSGGTHGMAYEFVTYAEWQTNRFNGCIYDDPTYAPQWVSVCDPVPATIALPDRRETRYHASGKSLIDKKQIAKLAEIGLQEYRLSDSVRAAEILHRGNFGTPILVQRLDRVNEFYYLTPWEQEGQVIGLVDIDARFGYFKSVRIMSQPAQHWLLGSDSDEKLAEILAREINGKSFDIPEEKGRFKVYPGTYCIPHTLVWKPCRESWSPHLPFYQLVIGSHILYVRIDGHVYTHLTSGRGV